MGPNSLSLDTLFIFAGLYVALVVVVLIVLAVNYMNPPKVPPAPSLPSPGDYPTATQGPMKIGARCYELRRPLLHNEVSVPTETAIARIEALNDRSGDEDARYIMDHHADIPVHLSDAGVCMILPGAIRSQARLLILEPHGRSWRRNHIDIGIPNPNPILRREEDDLLLTMRRPYAWPALFVLRRRRDLE